MEKMWLGGTEIERGSQRKARLSRSEEQTKDEEHALEWKRSFYGSTQGLLSKDVVVEAEKEASFKASRQKEGKEQ